MGLRLRALLALSTLLCGACGAPHASLACSPHFDGTRFHNAPITPEFGVFDVLRWKLSSEPTPWPEHPKQQVASRPPTRVFEGIHVTWVGHATALVQSGGLNILTDPVWSDFVGPAEALGVPRRLSPGVRFEDLPPIDLVLLSHDHYDHFDLPTLHRLALRDHPRFVTGAGNEQRLEREGIGRAQGLDWWDCTALGDGARVCVVPAQHNSRRALGDGNRTLWAGFWLSTSAGSVYFVGDTGAGPHFAAIRARFGAPCVALLPIGAYRPRWFMRVNHIDPEEAVQAHDTLGAQRSIAVHYATFQLSDEGMYEPAGELGRVLASGAHAPFSLLPVGGQLQQTCGLSYSHEQ
jgi:L-ascorbate metabolism protein UlaG (beta-lactamase superfamily)